MFGVDDAAIAASGAAVLNYLGTQDTNQANVDVANSNNAWSAQQYATRYQTQVKDLQAAGLNPALAYGQSPGSAPQAQPVLLQNPFSSATEAFTGVKSTHGKYQHDVASANLADKMQSQVDSATDKIRAEIDKLKGDTNFVSQQDILKQTAWMLQQQGVANQERGLTEGQSRAVMSQTVENLVKDGTLKQLDIEAAKALDNLGRTSSQLKPVVDILRVFLRK